MIFLFTLLTLTAAKNDVAAPREVDMYIVTTIDGKIHALTSHGSHVWTYDTGQKFIRSRYTSPESSFILPTLEGEAILISNNQFKNINTRIKDLVNQTPLMSEDDLYYTGNRNIRAISININTGEPLLTGFDHSQRGDLAVTGLQNDHIVFGLVSYSINALDVDTMQTQWGLEYTELNQSNFHFAIESESFTKINSTVVYNNRQKWEHGFDSPVLQVAALSENKLIPVNLVKQAGLDAIRVHQRDYAVFAEFAPPDRDDVNIFPIVVDDSVQLLPAGNEEEIVTISASKPTQNIVIVCLVAMIVVLLANQIIFGAPKEVEKTDIQIQSEPQKPPKPVIEIKEKIVEVEVFKKKEAVLIGKNTLKIGKLIIYTDQILGTGSMGTTVYSGEYEGCPVAVKRLLKENYGMARKEIHLLLQADAHPCVVRFYVKEKDDTFVYLALEPCIGSLTNLIESGSSVNKQKRRKAKSRFNFPIDRVKIMQDAARGLAFLHSQRIVHRDVKPMNILIDGQGNGKIADMASGTKLNKNASTYETMAMGSIGWQATEILLNEKRSKKVDIFGLGCTYYYLLTNGQHPFGGRAIREQNIIEGNYDISDQDIITQDLLSKMIAREAINRPTAHYVANHPFYWDTETKLDFIHDISDRLDEEGNGTPFEADFENYLSGAIDTPWNKQIETSFMKNIEKYRAYNYSSVKDLLRIIRNKRNHYHELTPEIKSLVGSLPNGYYNYFDTKFPLLFVRLFNFAETFLFSDKLFQGYMTKVII